MLFNKNCIDLHHKEPTIEDKLCSDCGEIKRMYSFRVICDDCSTKYREILNEQRKRIERETMSSQPT